MQMRWLRAEEPRPAALRWARAIEWDRSGALALNRFLTPRLQAFWVSIDRLGHCRTWLVVMLAIALLGGTSGMYCAVHMFCVGSCALIFYKIVKNAACRARPCGIVNGVRRCVDPLDQWSFPSGHVLHGTAFGTVAMFYYPVLAVVLVPFLLLLGVSRVVLGLHYPSDVLAGAVLGAAIAATSLVFV
jgi:undecaprenyl-diphosphatase